MIMQGRPNILRFLRRTRGAVAVEFAIIASVLLLIIAGAFDLGHAWYMKQIVTNASREGARYGITYKTTAGSDGFPVRIVPSAITSPTIQGCVTNYLSGSVLPSNANPQITLGGAGLNTGISGQPLTVQVSATKTWFLLSGFIPSLGSSRTITATTEMLCE